MKKILIKNTEEMKKVFPYQMQDVPGKAYAQVTEKEMRFFDDEIEDLRLDIADVIDDYAREHNLKPKYDGIEEKTHLSVSTIKQMINGNMMVTRTNLYKLVVGLKMDLEDANKLFRKLNGELRKDCREDFICIKALDGKDDIVDFISQYNQYTTGIKLKDPIA